MHRTFTIPAIWPSLSWGWDARADHKQILKTQLQPLGEISVFSEEPEEIARDYVEQSLVVSQPVLNLGFKEMRVMTAKPFKREITTTLMLMWSLVPVPPL